MPELHRIPSELLESCTIYTSPVGVVRIDLNLRGPSAILRIKLVSDGRHISDRFRSTSEGRGAIFPAEQVDVFRQIAEPRRLFFAD